MNRLKKLRVDKGLTLKQLANDLNKLYNLNISDGQLSNYENGNRQPRNQETWQKLADYFNVSVPYIMGLSDSKSFHEILYSQADSKKIGLIIKYIRKSMIDSPKSFATLINKYLPNGEVSESEILLWESGEKLPTIEQLELISQFNNLDLSKVLIGDITNNYSPITIEKMVTLVTEVINKDAVSDLVLGLNDDNIMYLTDTDIIQMYNENLANPHTINSKKAILEYIERKRSLISEELNEGNLSPLLKNELISEAERLGFEDDKQLFFDLVFSNIDQQP